VDFYFHKALPVFFLCIFSSLICLKKLVFSNPDLLRWKVTASLSLFLKSEKIPALLYIGKGPEYRPFLNFDLFPWPWAQISNHGRACTQALLLSKIAQSMNEVYSSSSTPIF